MAQHVPQAEAHGFAQFYTNVIRCHRERADNPLVQHHAARFRNARSRSLHAVVLLPLLLFWLYYIVGKIAGWPVGPLEFSNPLSVIYVIVFVPLTFWIFQGQTLNPDRVDDLLLASLNGEEIAYGQVWPIIRLQWIVWGLCYLVPLGLICGAMAVWHRATWPLDLYMRDLPMFATIVLIGQAICASAQFRARRYSLPVAITKIIIMLFLFALLSVIMIANPDNLFGEFWARIADRAILTILLVGMVILILWMNLHDVSHQIRSRAASFESPPRNIFAFKRLRRKWRRENHLDLEKLDSLSRPIQREPRIWPYAIAGGVVALIVLALNTWDTDWLYQYFGALFMFNCGYLLGALLSRPIPLGPKELQVPSFTATIRQHGLLFFIPLIVAIPGISYWAIQIWFDFENGRFLDLSTVVFILLRVFFVFILPALLLNLIMLISVVHTKRLYGLKWHMIEFTIVSAYFIVAFGVFEFAPVGHPIRFIYASSSFWILPVAWLLMRSMALSSAIQASYVKRAYSESPVPFVTKNEI